MTHNENLLDKLIKKTMLEKEYSIKDAMKEYAESMVDEAKSRIELYNYYESNRT